MYKLHITDLALEQLEEFRKTGNKPMLAKIQKLFDELKKHPQTGTGKPEQLKGELSGFYSRRIDHKNRMIYKIINDVVRVDVISIKGHY